MKTQKDSTLRFMIQGIEFSIGRCETDLRTVTEFLDKHFEGLEAKRLPEYQKAIDSIRNYQEALSKHFDIKYKESIFQGVK